MFSSSPQDMLNGVSYWVDAVKDLIRQIKFFLEGTHDYIFLYLLVISIEKPLIDCTEVIKSRLRRSIPYYY